MSTNENTNENNGATEAKESKGKTVANDMASRRIFPTPEEAVEYLTAASDQFEDFADTPVAAPGLEVNEEGAVVLNPEIYTPEMDVMVSLLRKQGKGVKAIIIAPVPKLSVLIDSQAGHDWIEKIIHKELNHVAVRHLRDAADVRAYIDQMPTTIEGYITSERGTGGIIETYNELYKGIDAVLSERLGVWRKARLTKGEFKKALESKGYALEFYPALEDYNGASLFEKALSIGITAAKRKGLDPTIFERWEETRATKAFTPDEDEDEELDLDALTDALVESDTTSKASVTAAVQAADAAESEAEPA